MNTAIDDVFDLDRIDQLIEEKVDSKDITLFDLGLSLKDIRKWLISLQSLNDSLEEFIIEIEETKESKVKSFEQQIGDIIRDAMHEVAKLSKPSPNDYYTAANIAKILDYSQSTVLQRIVRHPKFPEPIMLPSSDGGTGGKRWIATEFHAWAKKQR